MGYTYRPENTKEGPVVTDEAGALESAYKSCTACKHLRVNDFHYFYCRALGDQAKADEAYNGSAIRLYSFPQTPAACPFGPQS